MRSNTFGISESQSYPLVDPRWVRKNRHRFRRDMVPMLERANSLYIPAGRWPARGWILLERSYLDLLDKYGTDFILTLDAFDGLKTGALSFYRLAIVQSQCVTTGVSDDADAIYLIELTDQRGVLCSPWFEYPTDSYYNVLAPAYPGDWYANSLNAGVPWTWNLMVSNLWAQMNGFLEAYPGLPIVPASEPMNWIFPGVGAWKALCNVLDHIGCTVTCDLTLEANQYGIVQDGADDDDFDDLVELYERRKLDDYEYIDVGSGRVPGFVRVCFHRVNQFYGTEETIRKDSLQWETGAVYAVVKAAPATFAGAQGTALLWDDYPIRYDVDGNPTAADVANADVIATNRVQQFYDRIYSGTQGYMRRVYSGVLPFLTGSKVDGVAYKQDFGGTGGPGRSGWTTTIVQGPQPPFAEWET